MSFEVTIRPSENHSVITLHDVNGKCSVEIYSFGALLNKFSAWHNNETLNVIDGFSSVDDAIDTLTPFFKSAKLSPYVCRLNKGKYNFAGEAYDYTKYSSNGHALHGLIYDKAFEVASYFQSKHEASVSLEYTYDVATEGYPFRYKCSVKYKLSASNCLTVSTTISNLDNQLMPITDGWHPYFTLGDTVNDYLVEFQSKEMVEFDETLIPTGKLIPYQEFGSLKIFGNTFFDNCFTLDMTECQPMCVIRNPNRNVQVEFHPEKSYPYLQFYTPDHRKSIAIENLSAAPDAFNNGMGLKILNPGENEVFTVKYIIRSL